MGKRFSNLEDVYNTLTAANFNFDNLPANNKYRKYKTWKQNPEQRQLPTGSAQLQGPRRIVTINPFGLDISADNQAKVGVSNRSFELIDNLGGSGVYNHVNPPAATAKKLSGLIPAKAIVAVKLSTSRPVAATSNRITGRAYKVRTGETYTIPFGASAEATKEFEIQEDILSDRAATHQVTFTPERLYRR